MTNKNTFLPSLSDGKSFQLPKKETCAQSCKSSCTGTHGMLVVLLFMVLILNDGFSDAAGISEEWDDDGADDGKGQKGGLSMEDFLANQF